jgi:hypothetical protein
MARAGEESPSGWLVLPLLKRRVQMAILGWAFGIIIGFGLFAFIASVTIPYNYLLGFVPGCFTTILLGVALFIGAGSIWAMITDINRLRHAENYLIVITPDDFVKQEGNKIVKVPLTHVRYVTARGTPPPDRSTSGRNAVQDLPGSGERLGSLFVGRSFFSQGSRPRRKRMRTPTTLAFLDARNDVEVIVATDRSYGDPFEIAAVLKQYAARVQQLA